MDIIKLEYTDVFDENKEKELVFSKHLINSNFKEDSLFALQVDGQSMQPVINHKALIIADYDRPVTVSGYDPQLGTRTFRTVSAVLEYTVCG